MAFTKSYTLLVAISNWCPLFGRSDTNTLTDGWCEYMPPENGTPKSNIIAKYWKQCASEVHAVPRRLYSVI